MKRDFDLVSLVGGLATVLLGTLLLLDQSGELDLTFGWFFAAVCAAVGVTLAVGGLAERDR
jgi:hypothetical protein